MKKQKYTLTITKEQHSIKGTLFIDKSNNSLEFNPLTILSDLTFESNGIRAKNNLPWLNHINTEEGICQIDGFAYEYEYGFGEKIKVSNRDQYARLVRDLKRIIIYDKQIFPSDIEYLKHFYDITFDTTLVLKEEHPIQKFVKEKLSDERFFHYSNFSILTALDKIRNKELASSHLYLYDCFSLADVIFSVFYFLVLNNYKFSKCLHCENYFATTTYKEKYCNRKSSYQGFNHLNCEQAVRDLRQKLRRQQKKIVDNISANHSERLNDFYIERNKFQKFKYMNSIPDIKECEEFLCNPYKWYE